MPAKSRSRASLAMNLATAPSLPGIDRLSGRMLMKEARRTRPSSFFWARRSCSAVLKEMRLRRIQVRTRRQASDERMEKARLKRNGFIVALVTPLSFLSCAPAEVQVPMYHLPAKKYIHNCPEYQEWTERDGQLGVLFLNEHDRDADHRTDQGADKNDEGDRLPAEKRTHHGEELDVAPPHSFLAGEQLIEGSHQVGAPPPRRECR